MRRGAGLWTTLALSVAATSLFGGVACAKKVQLEVWDWYPSRFELWKQMAKEYEKLNPNVTIKASLTDWGTYWNKIAMSIATNTGPDLFAFHNSWTGKFVKLLEPYPEQLFPMRKMTNEYALFSQAFAFGNKFYFYPQGLMTSLIFYNKNLWAESGLGATPGTWDEFRLDARKMTRMKSAGKFDRVGFDLPPWQAGLLWTDLRYQSGGYLYSADKKGVEWGDTNGQQITSLLYDMTIRDHSTPVPIREATLPFEQGKVGMSYQWTFMKSTYMKFPKLNYGTFMIPTASGQSSPARARSNFEVGFAVPKNDKPEKKAEAFKFLRWLYDNERFYLTLNDSMGTIPARKSLWSKPEIANDVVQANVALQAHYTVFPGEFPSWMSDEVLVDMLTQVMQSKMLPEQAVKRAADVANSRIKILPLGWVVERAYRPSEGL